MTPERRRILFGTDEIPAPAHRLEAGALSCDLVDGAVRRLSCHGVEIVRGVSFLIRDEAWGTPAARLGEPLLSRSVHGIDAAWDGSIAMGDATFRFGAGLALRNGRARRPRGSLGEGKRFPHDATRHGRNRLAQ